MGTSICGDWFEWSFNGFADTDAAGFYGPEKANHNEILLLKIQTHAHSTCKQPKVEVNTTDCSAKTTHGFMFFGILLKVGRGKSVDEIK